MVIAGGEFVVANLKNQSVPKTPLFFVFELLFRLFVFFGIVCIHKLKLLWGFTCEVYFTNTRWEYYSFRELCTLCPLFRPILKDYSVAT
jgi:hypothetical protein